MTTASVTVTFIHKDGTQHTVTTPENHSLMEAGRDNNIPAIDGACGGVMACATCHCYIHPDWTDHVTAQDNTKTDEEADMLDVVFDERPTSRLSCQIKLTQALDGLIVGLPGSQFTTTKSRQDSTSKSSGSKSGPG